MLLLGVFHKPVGLSDAVGNSLVFIGIGCNLLCLFLYRRKKARLDGAKAASTLSPRQKRATESGQAPATPQTQPKWMFWLILALLVIVSLSGVFWLPYTGIALTFPQLVLVSITTCILSIIAFLIGRRRARPKV